MKGTAVNTGPQGYALVITGDLGSACTGAGVGSSPGNLIVSNGQPASFTVTGTGTGPLSYQWRRNTVNLTNDGRITNATTPMLTITSTVMADAGNYDCIVSNACGSAPSDAASLAVTCYPDCDGVGGLTANDFQCFVDAFASGAAYANCDSTGGLTANDFQCFLNAFVAGCP